LEKIPKLWELHKAMSSINENIMKDYDVLIQQARTEIEAQTNK
jgi:hypothetical protein